MTEFQTYIASDGTSEVSLHTLDDILNRHEWFTAARIARQRKSDTLDAKLQLVATYRSLATLQNAEIDVDALLSVTSDELIERFLHTDTHRIVAEDGEVDEEVTTSAALTDDDDIATEELAEIYLAQGLCDRAIATYSKLILLNPEKSVYFAELIDKIKNK